MMVSGVVSGMVSGMVPVMVSGMVSRMVSGMVMRTYGCILFGISYLRPTLGILFEALVLP